MNSVASAFPAACCGVSERMPNYSSLRIEDSPQLAAESFNPQILLGAYWEKKIICKPGAGLRPRHNGWPPLPSCNRKRTGYNLPLPSSAG